MNDKRMRRINQEMKKVISQIISHDLKDPSIAEMTSINDVEITRDLSRADVYVSVLGSENEQRETLKGLNRAKGYIKKELGNKMDLRAMPDLVFHQDKSIAHGVYMSQLIDQVTREDEEKRRSNS